MKSVPPSGSGWVRATPLTNGPTRYREVVLTSLSAVKMEQIMVNEKWKMIYGKFLIVAKAKD